MEFEAEITDAGPVETSLYHIKRACFSARNSTRLPAATALAIMFAIVCDFPVPGGPESRGFSRASFDERAVLRGVRVLNEGGAIFSISGSSIG